MSPAWLSGRDRFSMTAPISIPWLLIVAGLTICKEGYGVFADTLETSVVTHCDGSNVRLNEADPQVTPSEVYVFRGGESLASTTVNASGTLTNRLFVYSDGSVVLNSLTLDDLGKYTIELKVHGSNTTKRTLRLLVTEPPRTTDGKLFVYRDPRVGPTARVMCGTFESLGYPPASAVWRDPLGRILASDEFKEGFFHLDVSAKSFLPGKYCCQLDCPLPDSCCLGEESRLRECVEVEVVKDLVTDSGCDNEFVREEITRLQNLWYTLSSSVQSLQDRESQRQNCSQNMASAMVQLVHSQLKDQLEEHWTRVREWESAVGVGKLSELQRELEMQVNQSLENIGTRMSEGEKNNLEQKMVELETRLELRLSKMADNLTSTLQDAASLRQADAARQLETRMNRTLQNLETTLLAYISSLNQSVESLRPAPTPATSKPEYGFKTCLDLLVNTTKSGVYTLRPDGYNTYSVYCDMLTDGGGWLVFQRRQDGSEDFNRDWVDYENGFGSITGEFWLGLKKLHSITSARRHRLRVDMRDHEGERKYAEYDNFRVESPRDGYRLTVAGYSGTAGDSLGDSARGYRDGVHNRMAFSTRDRDNDRSVKACAQTYSGAWWYNDCHDSNLNGLYKARGSDGWDGINWYSFRRDKRSLAFVEMKIRPF